MEGYGGMGKSRTGVGDGQGVRGPWLAPRPSRTHDPSHRGSAAGRAGIGGLQSVWAEVRGGRVPISASSSSSCRCSASLRSSSSFFGPPPAASCGGVAGEGVRHQLGWMAAADSDRRDREVQGEESSRGRTGPGRVEPYRV
jgi:hypothetical protein